MEENSFNPGDKIVVINHDEGVGSVSKVLASGQEGTVNILGPSPLNFAIADWLIEQPEIQAKLAKPKEGDGV